MRSQRGLARVISILLLFFSLLYLVALISDQTSMLWLGAAPLISLWDDNKSFLNSNFITSVAGALAGAFFGATAAQKIADKTKSREESLRQIRLTNTATSLALTILNSVSAMRMQHTDRLKTEFDKSRRDCKVAIARARFSGGPMQTMNVKFDLQQLTLPFLPIDRLEQLVLEQINSGGIAASAMIMVRQSSIHLAEMLDTRNGLCKEFKAAGLTTQQILPLYFGLNTGGVSDERYASSVDGIYSYSKDIAFFTKVLCDQLVQSGRIRGEKFENEFGRKAPHITSADFTKAIEAGQIPPDSEYQSWLSAHVVVA